VYSDSSRFSNSDSASFAAIFDKVDTAIYATSAYGNAAYLIQRTDGTQGNWSVPIATACPIDTWAQNTIVYNSTTVATDPIWYVNGSTATVTEQVTPTGTRSSDSAETLVWGNRADTTRAYTGDFDEIRYRSGTLSSTWISTEYNNQSSPSTFYSTSDEQGGGGATFLPKVFFL
jgi:hypothetical protein